MRIDNASVISLSDMNGASILIVDDDPNFRLITREHLSHVGFSVFEADSGEEALKKIQAFVPDLIILDAIMGGMDGFEVCRHLKMNQELTDVPIIMSTGLDDSEAINKAFEVGASDFITKPLNYGVLVHHIRFLLRASKTTAELRHSKLQLSAAQRIARIGYWTWNVETDHFVISSYLAELFRIDPDDFVGSLQSFIALIAPEDRLKVESAVYKVVGGTSVGNIEYKLTFEQNIDSTILRQETALLPGDGQKVVTGTVQDVSKQKKAEYTIHQLAFYDDLTGLASRASFHEKIEQFISKSLHGTESFAFLYLDLDEFKDVNDSFGHNVGDLYLKEIANRIRAVIREVDFAARLGGDEFCIIIDNLKNEEQCLELAKRCLNEINQPLILTNKHFRPRASIGISICPKDGTSEEELMKAADVAMYSAKRAGKQQYALFHRDMRALALKQFQDEQMLREAVKKHQFVLFFQPQINMLTGRVVGLEALIRWRHPVRGLVSPYEFMPLAESMGLIIDIGEWVLTEACNRLRDLFNNGWDLSQMSVNIASVHFRDPNFVKTIGQVLHATSILPKFLQLEVTEAVMQTENDFDIFIELKKLGIKIAIDDFGTGYSSLAALKEVPVDCIKLDRIFVQDMLYNHQTPVLLGTIISLANAMSFNLEAEGVESIEQALMLHGMGCNIVQGYYFSRAVPFDQITDILTKNYLADYESFSSNRESN